jgi:hypothetical protein
LKYDFEKINNKFVKRLKSPGLGFYFELRGRAEIKAELYRKLLSINKDET